MKTNKTVCLNKREDGGHPYIEDRIYYWGGCAPTIPATQTSYGGWILVKEDEERNTVQR